MSIFARVGKLFWDVVAWFRADAGGAPAPAAAPARPVTFPAPPQPRRPEPPVIAAPPSAPEAPPPTVEAPQAPAQISSGVLIATEAPDTAEFLAPEPQWQEPRAKWAKPKGLELIKRHERAESTEAKPKAPPRPKRARPKMRPDENPEQWGQYYFRDAILDQLDRYFVYLKRMRRHDKDAYELHRRIGIQVMPGSAVQAFDNWRSEEGMNDLSAWWKEHRPAFGAISYGIDYDSMDEERAIVADLPPESFPKDRPEFRAKHRIATLTGGNMFKDKFTGTDVRAAILWVPKFLYFHKYRKPPPDIQRVADGDIYSMTVYWDRVDGRSKQFEKKHKGGVPQDYAICVERATGEVRILRMLINDRIHIRHRRGPERGHMFSIPNKHWGVPTQYLCWAAGRSEASPEDYLRRAFIEAALMYEHGAMGSMIRIEATKGGETKIGNMVATFGVEVKRTSYFFKDRDITADVLTERGTRKPIFHIVRPHMRNTRKGPVPVHMHFSGLREFDWAGYRIRITVPVLDHFALPEFDIGSDHHAKDSKCPKGMVGMAEYGEMAADYIHKGAGAWKPSEPRP